MKTSKIMSFQNVGSQDWNTYKNLHNTGKNTIILQTSSTSSNCCRLQKLTIILFKQLCTTTKFMVKHHGTTSLLFHRWCAWCMENDVSKSPHYSNHNKIFNDTILETSSAQCHLWHCASSFFPAWVFSLYDYIMTNVGSERLHAYFDS